MPPGLSPRMFIRKGNIIKTVIADGSGDYKKLSDALTAITDASANKRYTLLVFGTISDTALISRKSYIDVIGFNACVNVTTNSNINAVEAINVVYSTWRNVEVHRIGTVTASQLYAYYQSGTTDATCKTIDCDFYNDIAVAVLAYHMGAYILSGSGWFKGCSFHGGSSTGTGYHNNGIRVSAGSNRFETCHFIAGGGTGGYGIESIQDDASTYINCHCFGGGSTSPQGLVIAHNGIDSRNISSFIDCVYRGGATGCGINVSYTKTARIIGGHAQGGSGGFTITDGFPELTGLILGGGTIAEGLNNLAINVASGSPIISNFIALGTIVVTGGAPVLRNGIMRAPEVSQEVSYTSADSGRFRSLDTTAGYLTSTMSIQIITPAPGGTTLKIGTSAGGQQVASGFDLSQAAGTYALSPEVVALVAGAYMYATPSAAVDDGSFRINFSLRHHLGASYWMNLSTALAARFDGCRFLAPHPASKLMRLQTAAINAGLYKFTNCQFEGVIDADVASDGSRFLNCDHDAGTRNANLPVFAGKNGAITSVADGGTIAHGLGATPTKCGAIGTIANEIVSVVADATNLTIAIKKPADGSAGTTQSIAWWAER